MVMYHLARVQLLYRFVGLEINPAVVAAHLSGELYTRENYATPLSLNTEE